MKRNCIIVFIVLLMGLNAMAQCPPNIGFEDGSFHFWESAYGKRGSMDNPTSVAYSKGSPISGIHTIYNKVSNDTETDKYGDFPVLCPNGSGYSVKLGNDAAGGQTSQVTYTYTIPSGRDFKLILNYAVVLQNPNHPQDQQPKFTAQVYNVTDDKYVDCPSFNFEASSSLPGFELSNAVVAGQRPASVYYKKWAATTINLTAYQGKTVRLEFTSFDCKPGAHFGYAYLDIDSDCGSGITGNVYCKTQNSTTLLAPVGFSEYTWYDQSLTTIVGKGQGLTLSPIPAAGTKYAVIVDPYLGIGCRDTLYTTLEHIDEDFNVQATPIIYGCPGMGVDLTASDVTAGSSRGLTFTYYQNVSDNVYLYKPEAITTSGKYYIKGKNAYGCQSVVPVEVIISDPELTVRNGTTVIFPATIDLSTTVKMLSGYTYSYYYDVDATSVITNYQEVPKGGTYYVKAASDKGCEVVKPVTIIVKPPPPFIIDAPTVFTPNGDGINDKFAVKLEGEIAFGNIKIFDRSGSLLYSIGTQTGYWDGTHNGKTLATGTYYWLFEGIDKYYRSKVSKGSYITLLR